MNKYGLSFHHLGLAVKSSDVASNFLSGLGYRCGSAIYDPLQKVNLMLCSHPDMPAVEVIWPGEVGGPLNKFLSRHKDGLVYHMCYTTRRLQASLDAMEADQLRVISLVDPTAAVLFAGKLVSFYMVVDVGIIEIIEE